jgi:hypothetical protein
LDISFVHITLGLVRFPKFLNKFLRPVKISKKYRKNPVTTEKSVSKYDNEGQPAQTRARTGADEGKPAQPRAGKDEREAWEGW